MSYPMYSRPIGDFEYAPIPLDDKAINGARMIQIAEIAVAEYNKKQNKNACFVKIDEGDWNDRLCAGWLYHLSIRVKDKDSEWVIEEMVWKGSSLEEENESQMTTQRPIRTARSISRRRIKKMLALARDLHERKTKKKLKTKGVTVEQEFLKCIPMGEEGYIDCTSYKLYFASQQGFLCYSFIHRKWLYTLADGVVRRIRNDLYEREQREVQTPTPDRQEFSEPTTCHAKDVPLEDILSPMILSFCWFFRDRYNYEKDKLLEIMEVAEARFQLCGGMIGDIKFLAADCSTGQLPDTYYHFTVNIWSRAWLKHVDCRSDGPHVC